MVRWSSRLDRKPASAASCQRSAGFVLIGFGTRLAVLSDRSAGSSNMTVSGWCLDELRQPRATVASPGYIGVAPRRVRAGPKRIASTNFGWDQANHLTGCGSAATHSFNGDGLRMIKAASGSDRARQLSAEPAERRLGRLASRGREAFDPDTGDATNPVGVTAVACLSGKPGMQSPARDLAASPARLLRRPTTAHR